MLGRSKLWACALAAVAALSVQPAAQAMTSIDLPQLYDGNMLGLAYRPTDGHLFVTQQAGFDSSSYFSTLVHEFSASGNLLNTTDLRDILPTTLLDSISYLPGSQEFVAQGFTTDTFEQQVITLSSDLTAVKSTTSLEYSGALIGHQTDTETFWLQNGPPTVKISASVTGAASNVLLDGLTDSEYCATNWCLTAVAPSWGGGFFVTEESDRGNALLEYDRQGNLLHTLTLDEAVFGFHPMALETDLVNHRLFVSMNNLKVFTISESEFLTAAIPEPGTWALMGLGMAFLPLARRRALRA